MKSTIYIMLLVLLTAAVSFAQQGWFYQNFEVEGWSSLEAVSFINKNKGAIVGYNDLPEHPFGKGLILQTDDAGQNWSRQTIDETELLFDVKFTDLEHGTVVGDNGTVLRTTDGGSNWYKQNSGTTIDLKGASFINENTGWVVGGGRIGTEAEGIILNTTDGGSTWINQLSNKKYRLNAVSFANENIGIAVGGDLGDEVYGTVLRTTNGGNTWIKVFTTSTVTSDSSFNDVFLLDENNGWLVGYPEIILKTSDGGATWITQNSNSPLYPGWKTGWNGVYFTDANNGTAVGGIADGYWVSVGYILRTTDGGENWVKDPFELGFPLLSVDFTNTKTGTAVGQGGTIIRIEDDVTSISENQQDAVITNYLLSQNYPNPFNPSTTISWQSPVSSHQTLKVYDLLGREVATLVDEFKPAGSYEVEFDASSLSSGTYFYRIQSGEIVATKKFLMLK